MRRQRAVQTASCSNDVWQQQQQQHLLSSYSVSQFRTFNEYMWERAPVLQERDIIEPASAITARLHGSPVGLSLFLLATFSVCWYAVLSE